MSVLIRTCHVTLLPSNLAPRSPTDHLPPPSLSPPSCLQAARTASSRCREGRYTFLLPPFPIYAKQTAPDKESLEWHLSNAGGFYYVPRLASLGDCAISVVLVAQKLLGLDLFHNYLEVCTS